MKMMATMALTMTPASRPPCRADECEDEGADVAVLTEDVKVAENEDEDVDVTALVVERNSEESMQPNWQPYLTKQLLRICWRYYR